MWLAFVLEQMVISFRKEELKKKKCGTVNVLRRAFVDRAAAAARCVMRICALFWGKRQIVGRVLGFG